MSKKDVNKTDATCTWCGAPAVGILTAHSAPEARGGQPMPPCYRPDVYAACQDCLDAYIAEGDNATYIVTWRSIRDQFGRLTQPVAEIDRMLTGQPAMDDVEDVAALARGRLA
jgi:hypothetical protein